MQIRTNPLDESEIRQYEEQGYLCPIRVLSDEQVSEINVALDAHISGQRDSVTYELTDPIKIRRTVGEQGQATFEYEDVEASKPHTFPFLFNLWKHDSLFDGIARNPVIAGFARQLLNSSGVHLFEDNIVIKNPYTKTIPWHQDYPYWPLATPDAITVWIALEPISQANGTMQVVPGSHKFGIETLPVYFGDASSLMKNDRQNAREISQDPAAEGHKIAYYDQINAGECGFHDSMLWHSSTPNSTDKPRRVLILRYVAGGTIWVGNERFPYDEVGIRVGEPIGGVHFPAVTTAF